MNFHLYICFVIFLFAANPSEAATGVAERYIALAVQGDLAAALPLVNGISDSADPSSAAIAERFRHRFLDASEPRSPDSGDALLDAVVAAYRDYWVQGLLARRERELYGQALDRSLESALSAFAPEFGPRETTANLERRLASALARAHYHVLVAPAPPLRDLFVWRAQREQRYTVELTEQAREVRVVFMNDFVSLGWKDYASLGLASTTGWVEDGVLYCVEWAYLLDSENFEVSYLKHEARHLADLEHDPGLSSVELEYRAKLTELAFARSTLPRLLADFSAKAAPNPDAPHAEANWRVVHDVHRVVLGKEYTGPEAWAGVSAASVNRAARALLKPLTAPPDQRLGR